MIGKLEPGTSFRHKLVYYMVTNLSDERKTTCLRLSDRKLVTLINTCEEDEICKPVFRMSFDPTGKVGEVFLYNGSLFVDCKGSNHFVNLHNGEVTDLGDHVITFTDLEIVL